MATTKTKESAAAKKPGIFERRDVNPGLHQVYPNPDQPGNHNFSVEIIAVPGLGADANYTWIRQGIHWLRDEHMLANKVSNARISVFEYPSQWFGKGAVNQRVDQIANQFLIDIQQFRRDNNKTPIIFLAHCLGGIILEKTLLLSWQRQSAFPSIYPYVISCIFLGTPFRGTKTQEKASALVGMAETVGLGNKSDLILILKEDSALLKDMLDEFVRLTQEAFIRVFCFYEAEKSNITSPFTKSTFLQKFEMIVDEAHATYPGVDSYRLLSDHFSLNKYASARDQNFNAVANQIKESAGRSTRILKMRENAASKKLVDESTYLDLLDFLRENISSIDIAVKGSQQRKSAADLKSSTNEGAQGLENHGRSWVVEDETFNAWREAAVSQLLWVHGATVQQSIASSVIEDLGKINLEGANEQKSIILSFFCDESDEHRRHLTSILKLLIRQMIVAAQDMAEYLLSDAKNSKKSGKQDFDREALNKTSVLWDTLQHMVLNYPGRVYIVLYGIDELSKDSLEQFLGHMADVPGHEQQHQSDEVDEPTIKWILLTRLRRPDVLKAFTGKAHEIDFADEKNAKKVDDDLWGHISSRVDEIEIAAPSKYFLKHHIHSRAQGNRIYVSLVIQEVKNKQALGNMTHADIRALVESFPYGLENMYEHIRNRVLAPSSDGIEYTKEVLRCLALAQRAPTMRELAVLADLPHDDQKDLKALKRYIIQCGSFVTLEGEDYDEDAMTVKWIDSTARIHLEKYAKDELAMDLRKMQHGIIALRCLQYVYAYTSRALTHEDYNKSDGEEGSDADGDHENHEDNTDIDEQETTAGEDSEDHPADGNANADQTNEEATWENQDEAANAEQDEDDEEIALSYPMEYWFEHAKLADVDVIPEFELTHSFWEEDSQLRRCWWEDVTSLRIFDEQTDVTALHVATLANYPALVEYLLKNGWEDEIHKEDSLGCQPLYAACHIGNDEIVNQLLGAGADIDYISDDAEYKVNALFGAAENGHVNIVKTLLEKDADINATSEEWGTPLYVACENDFIEVIRLLIDNKADPNLIGGNEKRAINIAAWNGNVEVVQILLDHGADIDPDEDYWYGSAVGTASRQGHAGVVKLLLSKGWSPTKAMENYGSFLTCAATYGHTEVVKLLITDEARDSVLEQALSASAKKGKTETVKVILENKPDIRHERAFILAATDGRDEVLELLFDRGVSQEKLDEALYVASDHERESTVKLLLRFGASPDAEGPIYGCTLTASAFDGTTNIMKALIDAKADVNKRGGDYGTPLQAAALSGDAENVQLLLDHGAVLNTEPLGIYGYPLQAAAESGDLETMRLLLKNSADVNAFGGKYGYALVAAADDSDTLNLLLNNGANPNVRGGDDNKPVIVIAAEELYKDDIELLLDKDADINATCDHGSTALMKCAWMMDDDGMQLLISRKADITISSKKWGTALHSAASQGYTEGCRLLLDAGADIAAVGGELGTPLTAAAKSGDIDTLRLLLEADHKNITLDLIAGEFGTPLQAASAAGNTEIAEELIEHGAAINLQPPNGTYGYPLHAAAQMGDAEILDLLLKNHADVGLEGGIHGFALIAAAATKDQLDALYGVRTLLSHGAAVSPVSQRGLFGSAVAAAAFANHDEVLSLLIEEGADIHQMGGKYGSPLICAVIGTVKSSGETNDEDTVDTACFDTLLSHGADVNHRSSGKYHTALIAASYFDRHELVSKLLNQGADLGARFDGKHTSAVAAAAIKGNSKTLEMLLEKNPPAQLLDEALVESCAHRQFSSVKTLVQKGANLHKRHPVFGTAMDALNSPQADAYNSDDELMSDDDDSDDSDEEDSDDEGSDEDEEDGSDEDDDSDGESETSVPDEAGESEELKIRKLLEENLKPLRRKTTVKRGQTVKRYGLPDKLQSGPIQEQPFEASYQQHQVSVGIEFNGMSYVQHQQQQQQQQQQFQAPHQPVIQPYAPVSHQASENIHAGKLPPSLPYTANSTSSGPYPTQPEPLRRKPVPSRYTPSPTGQKSESVSSQQTVTGTRPSLAPQSHKSQDYVYQNMNPAAGGTPPTNQGPAAPFQRQSSYGSPPVYNSQQAYSPYNPPPATGQYAAPATQPPYNLVLPQQQYMTAPYHQPPPPNTYPQPYQQHTGQAQNQYSPSPPQSQYQPFTPPQPSQQQTGYTPYGQQSRLSSTTSYQTSQSDNSSYWGSQHTMYSTPNSSQASGLDAQYPKPGARRE